MEEKCENGEKAATRRIKLVVAYDGSNYQGWQLQPNGGTVEGVLNEALTALLGEPIAVIGASRTDSGVHAMGNVAIFDTVNRMPADKICFALNQRLPEDIRIQESMVAPDRWHPRKCRCAKTYEYHIWNRRIDMPIGRLYAHFCYTALDVDKMRAAASYLVGEHDFKSFCAAGGHSKDTVRTIYSLEVGRQGDRVTIRVCGSGFLYNMVRIIAGTLMEVGKGFYGPEEVEAILLAKDRKKAGPTAPAKGLTLVSLDYEEGPAAWFCRDNQEWGYHILQSHVVTDKTAYFLIGHCSDGEWAKLLERNIHHVARDGADYVYLVDLEKDRLKAGDSYGHYEIRALRDGVGESQELTAAMGWLTADESAAMAEICRSAVRQVVTEPVWYLAYENK